MKASIGCYLPPYKWDHSTWWRVVRLSRCGDESLSCEHLSPSARTSGIEAHGGVQQGYQSAEMSLFLVNI